MANRERHWGMYKLDGRCILAHGLSFFGSGSRQKSYKLDAASVAKLTSAWQTGFRHYQAQ